MFETPLDALPVWVGLTTVSLLALGVAAQFPTTAPPDAVGVADAIDAVAVGDYPTTAEIPSSATRVHLGPDRVRLENDGGRSAATLATGVVPARESRLQRVLHGADPDRVFDSPAAFETTLASARTTTPEWQETDGTLVVRRLTWGGVNVTLVGD